WFFQRFKQHVGGAFGHAVGIFNNHHAITTYGWRELRACHESAHFIDGNNDPLGAEYPKIWVGSCRDLASRGFVALRIARTEQCRRESVGKIGTTGAWRSGDEPRMCHR